MMSASREESLRFFKYVEESGLRAYKGLLTQNFEHAWNEQTRPQENHDKKRKQEEAIKRTLAEAVVAAEGRHQRMGSMSMPAPAERMAPQPCCTGFAVRSQSLHSVGGGEEEGSPTSRRQPPPKPRRDPNTKLSISSEAVDLSPTSCRGGDSERCDVMHGCSEDCKRVPPPKPKRNPNTQLSTSFDESYIRTSGSKGHYHGSPTAPHSHETLSPSPPQLESPSRDSDLDEPVYIEMSGNPGREPAQHGVVGMEDEEPGEAVYEEMKYPAQDEPDSVRWDPPGCRSQCPTPCPSEPDFHTPLSRCSTPHGTPVCDIPAPFPNLLSHRPPLLVFPPAPAQCSPNSDESPLTPLDVAKLPMLENASYSMSPTSSSHDPPSSCPTHLRRAERELTATPTITVSGRSSAPPLPCTLYKSSSASAHGYQRSHSACPSPVSMGRCLTPLSLMRAPPFEGPFPGAGMPRSASATPHGKGSPPHDGRLHGSLQNVAVGRSRTPTSPLDELTNLFTTGRNMLKKNSSGRKSKEPAESDAKGRGHSSEAKREHKDRSHHSKESKRDKERSSHSKSSSHRRDNKEREINTVDIPLRHDGRDRGCNGVEPLPRRDSRDRGCNSVEPVPRRNSNDRGCNSVEPLPRRDSSDRGCNSVEPLPRRNSNDRGCNSVEPLQRRNSNDRGCSSVEPLARQDSKDRGCNSVELLPRRDSKDRVCNNVEPLPRRDSKDRGCSINESLHRQDSKDRNYCSGTELLHRQDSKDRNYCNGPELLPKLNSKELSRNGLDSKRDGKDGSDHGPELLPRQDAKDMGRNGLDCRHESKDSIRNGLESRRDARDRGAHSTDCKRDSKERVNNGTDGICRRSGKDRVGPATEALPRYDGKDSGCYSKESPKAHDKDTVNGSPTGGATGRLGRSPLSPTVTNRAYSSEIKTAPKVGRSPSTPVAPSPLGTPQRQTPEAQQVLPMPWMYGDSTMLEMIEKKQLLCREIRSCQRPLNRSPCKQESLPALPSWKKTNRAKKYLPPPYPTQTTVFWDTAI